MKCEISLNENLDSLYACPQNHPITCANPAPWLIQEVKVEFNPLKVWIRNEESMWFRANQCIIGEKEELQEIQVYNNRQDVHDIQFLD